MPRPHYLARRLPQPRVFVLSLGPGPATCRCRRRRAKPLATEMCLPVLHRQGHPPGLCVSVGARAQLAGTERHKHRGCPGAATENPTRRYRSVSAASAEGEEALGTFRVSLHLVPVPSPSGNTCHGTMAPHVRRPRPRPPPSRASPTPHRRAQGRREVPGAVATTGKRLIFPRTMRFNLNTAAVSGCFSTGIC